jgi:hypothetical protein
MIGDDVTLARQSQGHFGLRHQAAAKRWPGPVDAARFVERHSEHRFVACRCYPDYDPSRPGATLSGRALAMRPLDTGKLDPLVRNVLLPPGYLPMSFAEWDSWRYPDQFDWDLLRQRERTGVVTTGGAALVAALADGAVKAGVGILTGVRLAGTGRGSADVERGGQVTTIATTAVILATGGFDWDRQLRGRWQPPAQRASGAPPSNAGDGLRIAEHAGAITDNLAEGWWMPMMAVPGETLLGEQFYRSLIRGAMLMTVVTLPLNAAPAPLPATCSARPGFRRAVRVVTVSSPESDEAQVPAPRGH